MLVDWLDDPVCLLAVFLLVRVYAYWLATCSLAMCFSVRSCVGWLVNISSVFVSRVFVGSYVG